jgi:hypothetical protein
MPFDRAQYRHFTIWREKEKRRATIKVMKKAIENALAIRDAGDMYQNPLTDFFGVPLSSFSSAYALARGYYYNLIKPAVKGLQSGQVVGSAFSPERYSSKSLEVIIPDDLRRASTATVERIVTEHKAISPVTVEAEGRKRTLYEWANQPKKQFRWMDIPTTMALLRDTVLGRLGRDANPNPNLPEYKEIQQDEIDQFQRALHGFINKDLSGDAEQRMVEIVPWSKTELSELSFD